MAARVSAILLVITVHMPAVHSQNFESVGGTGGLIGIIVSCVVMVLFCFGAFLGFVVVGKCRVQNKPSDNTTADARRAAYIDDGYALPVDIPVEALAREPPPRYDSIAEPTALPAFAASGHVSVISDNPPAYSETMTSLDDRIVSSRRNDFRSVPFLAGAGRRFESPPDYRSRVELDASRFSAVPERSHLTGDASVFIFPPPTMMAPMPLCSGSVSAARSRLHSVDSFPDIPSMSDVLLTSSRTTLPTSASQATALDAASAFTSARRPHDSARSAASSSAVRSQSALTSGRSADNVFLAGVENQLSGDDGASAGTRQVVTASLSPRQSASSAKRRRLRKSTSGDVGASPSSLEPSPTSSASTTSGCAADRMESTDSTPAAAAAVQSTEGSSAGVPEVDPVRGGKHHRLHRRQDPDQGRSIPSSSLSRSLPGLSSINTDPPEILLSASTPSIANLKVVGLETVV